MRKLLSALFALILVVSLLVPVFTLADETGLSDAEQSPSCEVTPTPSGEVTPTPSGEVTPTPSGEVTPTPSGEVTPTPSGEVTPTPSGEVTPTPSSEVTPTPSGEVTPTPSGEVTPTPSVSPSPYEGITDPAELYKILISLTTIEEFDQFIGNMSEDQQNALKEYVFSQQVENSCQVETVPFADAGPLVNPVCDNSYAAPLPLLRRSYAPVLVAPTTVPIKNTEGVELSKTVSTNQDGTYAVRLESYTTGSVTTTTEAVPADIVLVLDQSGSMADTFTSGITKQQAMKNAVSQFIADVATNAGTNKIHRIAIVTYNSGAAVKSVLSNNYSDLQTIVSTLSNPSGATRVDSGMNKIISENLFGTSGSNRNKIVIVFTDGVPTTSNNFETGVATSAISTSYNLKNTLKATVYSIGIFGGANPNELYGDRFDYLLSINHDVPCHGRVDEIWGASNAQNDDAFVDIAAGNRFLNCLSSNYPNVTEIGIVSGDDYNPGNVGLGKGKGYKITTELQPNGGKYYLTASNTTDMGTIFSSISTQIGAPTISLGNSTSVKDIVSQYFDAPADISQISVYTADCTGKTGSTYNWSGTMVPFTATKTIDSGTIIVSGFSYDDNFVTAEVKPNGGGHGKKLVICFNVTVRAGFWGGNLVPTNGSDSGLYADNTLIENFARPTVNVPLSVPFSAKDFSIYLGTSVSSSSMYNAIAPGQEWMDDYVNTAGITYSPTNPTCNLTADKTDITVTATVSPLYGGTVGSVTLSDTSTICVYKPVITYSDSQIYLGEKASYPDSLSIEWRPPVSVTPVPAMPIESAPVPTATYTPGVEWFKTDTQVNAIIFVGGLDITESVTFKNNAHNPIEHTGDQNACEFTVKVNTCTLEVKKSGCNTTYGNGQTFIFHITGVSNPACKYAEDVDLKVVVSANNPLKTITGLPVGIYTVTEDSGWSWRYAASNGTATLVSGKHDGKVLIENVLKELKKIWLSGSNFASNLFN